MAVLFVLSLSSICGSVHPVQSRAVSFPNLEFPGEELETRELACLAFFASAANGLTFDFSARLFLALAFEQPSLIYSVWSWGEALRGQVSFSTGYVYDLGLLSVMIIRRVAKGALL